MKAKNTGARWEVTVDGKPRTYDCSRELANEAAKYLKLKNPAVEVTRISRYKARRRTFIPPGPCGLGQKELSRAATLKVSLSAATAFAMTSSGATTRWNPPTIRWFWD